MARKLLPVAVLACLLLISARAEAYTWMIRSGHAACVSCHVDPSGAGLLTGYGREQGADLLRPGFFDAGGDDETVERRGRFLAGLISTPDWLLLGGSFRPAILGTDAVSGGASGSSVDVILMQADLRAGVRAGAWRASASAGVITTDASYASIAGQLVSREHWLGYAFDHDTFTLRAGRMNLPYGLRVIEHTLWVREQTRTNINDQQQHGVAFAYNSQRIRAEVMGILGNYQTSPDAFRERGYSGYLELTPLPGYAVGASSLITHAAEDIVLHAANTRQAHGLFLRAAPWAPLVVLAEGDVVINRPGGGPNANGLATMLQLDVEPLQGLHLIGTGETWRPGGGETGTSHGLWGSIDWFFLPHCDLRFDYVRRAMAFGGMTVDGTVYLAQLHIYL
jgi:hypothetical protein